MLKRRTSLPIRGSGKYLTRKTVLLPPIITLVRRMCDEFIELRREKAFLGRSQLVCGLATLGHRSIGVLILYENDQGRKNSAPVPTLKRLNGYQKTQHLFRLARKFNRPIIIFTSSSASLPSQDRTEPDDIIGFAKHVLSQSNLEVPLIFVALSRKMSGDIFGAWRADKVLAFENARFSMVFVGQWGNRLIQVGARSLLYQGIIDKMISVPARDGPSSRGRMPTPKQLRIALGTILDEVFLVSPEELRYRRRERIEKVSAMVSGQYGFLKMLPLTTP
jgi:acetyl-CoA carboxylase alpha subunit